jgi:hypothetical protein
MRARMNDWDRLDAGDQSRNQPSPDAAYIYGLVQLLDQDLLLEIRDRGCIVDAFSVQTPVALVACTDTAAYSLHV